MPKTNHATRQSRVEKEKKKNTPQVSTALSLIVLCTMPKAGQGVCAYVTSPGPREKDRFQTGNGSCAVHVVAPHTPFHTVRKTKGGLVVANIALPFRLLG